jgi:FKBP-type peptidyl-prolyl cis-trans isomerase FkpA
MRTLYAAAIGMMLTSTAFAAEPQTEDEKALYALGYLIAQNLAGFNLTEAELQVVNAGIADAAMQKDPKVDPQTQVAKLQDMQKKRTAAVAQAYLQKAGAEKGAKQTPSGLIITTLKEGKGQAPKESDTVKVHYHGTLPNGKVFDSSVQRNEPATFPLSGVIKCWTEGVQLMKVGGKSKLVCPAGIAYGDRGAPPSIPPGATLIFEVELLGIEPPAAG